MNRILGNKFFVGGTYAVSSLLVFLMWVIGTYSMYNSLNGDPRSKVSDLIYGKAHNPFVQRALVPVLTRSIYEVGAEHFWSSLRDRMLAVPKLRNEVSRLGWEEEFIPQYCIALSLSYLSLLAFMFVLRSLMMTLYETSLNVANFIPVVTVFCLPVFFHSGTHYIYDFPAMFFFTAALLSMIRRKWLWYYVALVLGSFNKETMVFLLLPFVLLFGRNLTRSAFIKHLVAQLLIFLLIKGSLVMLFLGNPGKNIEFHFFGNLHNMLFPYSFMALVFASVIAVVFLYDIDKKPRVLRQSAWLLVPFIVLTFSFGWFDEARAMYEIFPIFFLMIAHTIFFSIFQVPYRLRSVPSPVAPIEI